MPKDWNQLWPFYEALHPNWNMESTRTRKRRSIDEGREVIKLWTKNNCRSETKVIFCDKCFVHFHNLNFILLIESLFLFLQNGLHVLYIRLYFKIPLYIYWQINQITYYKQSVILNNLFFYDEWLFTSGINLLISRLTTSKMFNLEGCTSKELILFFLSRYR